MTRGPRRGPEGILKYLKLEKKRGDKGAIG